MSAKGKRFRNGTISVIKTPCSKCHHHKAFQKLGIHGGIECTRCGNKEEENTPIQPKKLSEGELDTIIENAKS